MVKQLLRASEGRRKQLQGSAACFKPASLLNNIETKNTLKILKFCSKILLSVLILSNFHVYQKLHTNVLTSTLQPLYVQAARKQTVFLLSLHLRIASNIYQESSYQQQ